MLVIRIPMISQDMLVNMIRHHVRPCVGSFLNTFQKPGFIEYKGGLPVHNSLLNIVLHA